MLKKWLSIPGFIAILFFYGQLSAQKQSYNYVNPFIGTGGHGHTYPGATLPFGMVQLSPDTRLEGWDGQARADSQEMLFVELTRQEVMRNLLRQYLGENTSLYEWRSPVFLENVLKERPANWLPKEYLNFDALLTASADQAGARIDGGAGSGGAKAEVWGASNALRMEHPLSLAVPLKWFSKWMSIGPTEQSG